VAWREGFAVCLGPWVQVIAHQAGTLAMFSGLFLLYGSILPEGKIEPVLALSSITISLPPC